MSLACEKSLFAGAVLCLSLLATLVQAADPGASARHFDHQAARLPEAQCRRVSTANA